MIIFTRWICLFLLATALLHAQDAEPPARYQVLPGSEAEVASLLPQLKDNTVTAETWEQLFQKHGADSLRLLIVLSREEPFKDAIQAGFETYLTKVPAHDTVVAAKLLSAPDYQRLLYLVDMLSLEKMDREDALDVMRTLNDLGEYPRAYDFGHRAWLQWQHITIMGHTMRAVREGNLTRVVWEQAGEKLYAHHNDNYAAMEICFYAEIARALHEPLVIRSLLRIAGLQEVNPNLMAYLVERLDRLGLDDEIKALLQNSSDASLRYLKIALTEDREPTPDEWTDIFQHAVTSRDSAILAERLTQQQSPTAAEAWKRVLALPDLEVNFRRDANLRLYQLAEKAADFESAANYLQEALHTLDAADPKLKAQRQAMAHNIAELRRQAASGSNAYERRIQLARAAIRRGEYEQAETIAREAVKLDPQAFAGHSVLFTIYKVRNEFSRLPTIARILARLQPRNNEETLNKAFQLAEVMMLDKAMESANAVIKALPDDPRGYLARATIHERQQAYDLALADLDQAAAKGADDHISRLRGLVYAKQGNRTEAVKAFDRQLMVDPDLYVRLWRHLLQAQLGPVSDADLKAGIASATNNNDTWIQQLYRFCLGDLDQNALLKAAVVEDDPNLTLGHECEAWFYMGLYQLGQNQPRSAQRAFENALAYDIPVYIETPWAKAELERLKK